MGVVVEVSSWRGRLREARLPQADRQQTCKQSVMSCIQNHPVRPHARLLGRRHAPLRSGLVQRLTSRTLFLPNSFMGFTSPSTALTSILLLLLLFVVCWLWCGVGVCVVVWCLCHW